MPAMAPRHPSNGRLTAACERMVKDAVALDASDLPAEDVPPKPIQAVRGKTSRKNKGRSDFELSFVKDGNFACTLPRTPETLYLKMGNSSTGAVTTKRELGLTLVDFFDYSTDDPTAGGVAQFVNNYFFDVSQNLLDTAPSAPGGQSETFLRVRRLEVWALPQTRGFTGGTAAVNNARAMYTVNCQVPGVSVQFAGTASAERAFATNTQVTNILPQFDTKWKRVLTADLQKTFQSGVIRPFYSPDFFAQQCLFSMSIVNSVDGRPYLVGDDQLPIRVKVKLWLDQPIATIQNADLAVFKNEEFDTPSLEQNGAAFNGTVPSYVQLDLASVRDNMR